MSQREQNDAVIEWIVGPTTSRASVTLNGDTGALELVGVTVTVNGLPISTVQYRGNWSALTTYATGDIVTASDGDLYISIQNGNLNHDPAGGGSPTFWTKIVDVPTFVDVVATASASSAVPLTAEGASGQTADLFVVEVNGGPALGGFDAAGNVFGPNVTDILSAVLATIGDETATFPNSREIVAGTNVALDTTTPGQVVINVSGGGTPKITQAADLSLTGSFAPTDFVTPSLGVGQEVWIRAWMLYDGISNGQAAEVTLTIPAGAVGTVFLATAILPGPGTTTDTEGDATSTFTTGDPGASGDAALIVEGVVHVGATPGTVTVNARRTGAAGTLMAGSTMLYNVN